MLLAGAGRRVVPLGCEELGARPRPLTCPFTCASPRPRLGFVMMCTGPEPDPKLLRGIRLLQSTVWTWITNLACGRPPLAPDCVRWPPAPQLEACKPNRGLGCALAVEDGGGGCALGLTADTNCRFVKLRHTLVSTVDPRYCEHRLLSVVPEINGTSQTTSILFAFRPITTPWAASGTLPLSCTITTRSPRSNF